MQIVACSLQKSVLKGGYEGVERGEGQVADIPCVGDQDTGGTGRRPLMAAAVKP